MQKQKSDDNSYTILLSELMSISNNDDKIDIEDLKSGFRKKYIYKGNLFIREGETPNKIGFITKGLMKYYYIDSDGNEWIKHFSFENDFVASYASFLYQFPSLYFIEAIEESTILTIDYEKYINKINSSMTWNSIARKYTEKIYLEKELRESSLLKQDGAARYSNFLTKYKNLANRITIKDTASFLGITPVSLSRIRNNKQGKINKC